MTEISPRAPRRAALVFIFVTVVLDMLALGMIIPVLPKLVEGFLDGDTVRAAHVYGVFGTVWALMQFVFSPILGGLSDRFGRRPIVLVSNFGLGLDYLLMGFAPSLTWLFIGRVISGITAASISTAFAYIADVSTPEKRAANFGILGAAFGLGFILGPALGGPLGAMNPHLPFWVAAGLSLTNAMYGLFVLPESLSKDRRSPFSWKRANPVGSLVLLSSRAGLLGLATVNFFGNLAHTVLPSTFVLYASHRYGWNEGTVGLTLASVGAFSMVVQAGLVRHVVAAAGERTTLLIGLFFGVIGFLVYGLADTGFMFWFGVPVAALWGLYGPAAQGLMTARVAPNEQGQLQGANSALMGIASLIGPLLFTQTFARFIADDAPFTMPGAPFVLAAMLLLIAFGVALTVAKPSVPVAQQPTTPHP